MEEECGICCMSLPSWNDLTDIERAFIRIHDRGAEELFKKVIKGNCPDCNRKHDILRGTGCICACGRKILSKEYSRKKTIDYLDYEME